MKENLKKLRELTEVQSSTGNYDYDAYMHGLANGMILAQSIVLGEKPKLLDAPKEWLADKHKSPRK